MVPLPLTPNLVGNVWYLLADPLVFKQDQHLWSEGVEPGSLDGFFLVRSGPASRKVWFTKSTAVWLTGTKWWPEGTEAWVPLLSSPTLGYWAWLPLGPRMLACSLFPLTISLWAQEAQLGVWNQLVF